MTPKQKIKSIENKMKRIETNNPEINFKEISKSFFEIEKYYKLRQDHFFLKFDLEHCEKCGKRK